MKILFVKSQINLLYISYFDMGISSISAVLKKGGHKTNYFLVTSKKDISNLYHKINYFKPDVVAFSANDSSFQSVKTLSKLIRNRYPLIHQICGGVHMTLYPQDFINTKSLNSICLGEGEYSFLEYVNNLTKRDNSHLYTNGFWTRKNKKIIKNISGGKVIDINKLPFPDREIFNKEGFLFLTRNNFRERGIEFIFSRGCPFRCTYCSNHALSDFYGPNYVRFRKPEKAIAEIKDVINKYRHDYFVFHDDTFTVNKVWLYKFLKLYKNINVPFICNVRVETVNKEVLTKLKKAGCEEVRIGLESGDEPLRREIMDRQMSNQQIKKVFKLAKSIGLRTMAACMLGLPHETPKKYIKTLQLFGEVNPDEYLLSIFYPYKGTKLYNLCVKEKLIIKTINKDFVERADTILRMSYFNRHDILYYYKNFDEFIKLYKIDKSLIRNLHRKILRYFATIPPSNRFFRLTQLIYHSDRKISVLIR